MAFNFEKLMAYQEALGLAKELISLSQSLRRNNYSLADQLRRAAMSVPANIAEGCGRWHSKDKIQFFRIAIGSANECIPFIDFAYSFGVLNESDHNRIKNRVEIVAKLIFGLIKATPSLKGNA